MSQGKLREQCRLWIDHPGNLTISSPLAFTEGLFIFFELFFRKKGFLILRVEYNLKVSSIYYFPLKRVKRGKRKI